jgi:hypothetical protein
MKPESTTIIGRILPTPGNVRDGKILRRSLVLDRRC